MKDKQYQYGEPRGWVGTTSADYMAKARQTVFPPTSDDLAAAADKKIVIIGAGVAGLTAAYELLKNYKGCECIILEANDYVGGRNRTVRPGDFIREKARRPQECHFEKNKDDPYQPYLNAGPGRIPSDHVRLLGYLKMFNVPLEVYVMASQSNRTYVEGHFDNKTLANRQLTNDMRGRIAEKLFNHLQVDSDLGTTESAEQLKSLLIRFGDLTEVEGQEGHYEYTGSSRSGYEVLPGITPGVIKEPLPLDEMLASEYWAKTPFYQPLDFLWQPTSLQPVGGMDKVVHAFQEQVETLKGTIQCNSKVTGIGFNPDTEQYHIEYVRDGTKHVIRDVDYCISNIPIPLLKHVLHDRHFEPKFREALHKVYAAQYDQEDTGHYQGKFLADTTKVGWQARRDLWQKLPNMNEPSNDLSNEIPIFGGISWSTEPNVQIWFPSDNFNAELGVLTGAYNFGENASNWGKASLKDVEELARQCAAKLGGQAFADGLDRFLAVAWQNMPNLEGGWADWRMVGDNEEEGVQTFNDLLDGSHNFHIVGDQLSAIPGWQEGAIASAINTVNRIIDASYHVPKIEVLPDTRFIVQGF